METKGGALSIEIVDLLKEAGVSFQDLGKSQNNRKYNSEYRWIKFEEYPDEVPIKQTRLVPSYKRMCIMILKNDISCRYMGLKKDAMYL